MFEKTKVNFTKEHTACTKTCRGSQFLPRALSFFSISVFSVTSVVKFLIISSSLIMLFATAGCDRHNEKDSPRLLKMATGDFPETLDPRKGRSLIASTTGRMFFEGLMRQNENGDLSGAVATAVTTSPDGLTYTFQLRPCLWSNGDPVTAGDFEYAWKKVLSPEFPAPYASFFYVIRGAKDAKAGKIPASTVGVVATDDHTLTVTLEAPSPQFLQTVTFPAFFPVNKRWDIKTPNWADGGPSTFVGNGPFVFFNRGGDELVAMKSKTYWDANHVKLDGIVLVVQDENTALQLFQSGQLDWVGSPLGEIPSDAIPTLKQYAAFHARDAAGTGFFRFNTSKEPFCNEKLRRAFSFAIDRRAIVDGILQAGQQPATTLVPSTWTGQASLFMDAAQGEAKRLLQEGLAEMHKDLDTLPSITMMYANTERNHRIAQAIQQQWQETLGLSIALRRLETKVLLDSLKRGDYEMSLGSWFADALDPANFLEVFRSSHNGTNNTGWEDSHFASILDSSAVEGDPVKRLNQLKEAEVCLIERMPIAPIFRFSFVYLSHPRVKDVRLSELGYCDFRDAYLEEAAR